jgi:hypothetical protein
MRDGAGAAPWAATARALLDRIDAATAVQTRLDARIEVLIEPYRRASRCWPPSPASTRPPHR